MTTDRVPRVFLLGLEPNLADAVSQELASDERFRCDCRTISNIPNVESELDGDFLIFPVFDAEDLSVLSDIKSKQPTARILVICKPSDRDLAREAAVGGADDLAFGESAAGEICARIEFLHLRKQASEVLRLNYGPLEMDLSERKVTCDDSNIALTPTEFRILEILMRNREAIVTRKMLCASLWNPGWEGVTNVIEVHMNRLRSKLKRRGLPQLIHTVRGKGYFLQLASLAEA
ncbi:MAG: winged-helix domain-containing protein [Planctomycetota bacterium]